MVRPAPAVGTWSMGDDVWLTTAQHRGVAIRQPVDRSRDCQERRLIAAASDDGTWTLRRAGQSTHSGDLLVVDASQPFDLRALDAGSIVAVNLPHARLTLPIESIRCGIDNLSASNPLVPFVCNHLIHLGRIARQEPTILEDLTSSTVALLRALLLTAAGDNDRSPSDELVARVQAYIDDHLTDSALSAESIAAEFHISTRKLYAEWPIENGHLMDFIIRRRLDRARDTLITRRHLTIPAVASAHGFSDSTHFAKRFRAAFGVTPTQWRRDNPDT
ncbi:helix-turn-helix domain-containing protein [Gordonia sp. NPDC003424]